MRMHMEHSENVPDARLEADTAITAVFENFSLYSEKL
jgi:hypothetical protein